MDTADHTAGAEGASKLANTDAPDDNSDGSSILSTPPELDHAEHQLASGHDDPNVAEAYTDVGNEDFNMGTSADGHWDGEEGQEDQDHGQSDDRRRQRSVSPLNTQGKMPRQPGQGGRTGAGNRQKVRDWEKKT
ncbi:hypothetical protein CF327_g7273 [Tilletia walkeri]|uniref:Uncharacterized protein n=1 Tax=Tilletia walkeri TaxID=117179 RepID=A0A8X7N1U3_9BASI|nr:hypothetical protein CF327_g7273 [Tilletia walkeri]KAE8264447.1 hypothetical protein A4X09_0g6961 [Tilletia walkeri]